MTKREFDAATKNRRCQPGAGMTQSQLETMRSVLMHEIRSETNPERRAVMLTEIEACNQRLERDYGVQQ